MIMIEYSVKQNAFHVDTMSNRMHENIKLAQLGIISDYVLVGVAPTRELANELIKKIDGVLRPLVYVKN